MRLSVRLWDRVVWRMSKRYVSAPVDNLTWRWEFMHYTPVYVKIDTLRSVRTTRIQYLMPNPFLPFLSVLLAYPEFSPLIAVHPIQLYETCHDSQHQALSS